MQTRGAFPRLHLTTARLLGGLLLAQGHWQTAAAAYASAREAFLAIFGQSIGEAEARDIIAEAGSLFAEAAYVAAQLDDKRGSLALASEGRARMLAFALMLNVLGTSGDRGARLSELRAAIRANESAVETVTGIQRAEALERLSSLRHELIELVASSSVANTNSITAAAQAVSVAGPSGAVLVPIVTNVGGKVLLITQDSRGAENIDVIDLPGLTTNWLTLLVRGETKAGGFGGWLAAYRINYLPTPEQSARWSEWLTAITDLGPPLWVAVCDRVHAALGARGVKAGARLTWLPTGALGIFPIALAQNPFTHQRFGELYEITYATSLEALAAAQVVVAKAAPPTLAAVINPTGDLPGSEAEGALVASHFASDARVVLAGAAASPEAVLTVLKSKSHWHFASHGTFAWEDARQSGLLMNGDMRLSVGRLLDAEGLGRPRMVVLSACETGLYDISSSPDEFIGLPGAFTALGAAGILSTLWPVSDAATALLIAKFYELYLNRGEEPSTALSHAQRWLREAKSADLKDYARVAASKGRLQRRHLADLVVELSSDALAHSRNRSVVEWLPRGAPTVSGLPSSADATADAFVRPYAHPYFWAGFILTGL